MSGVELAAYRWWVARAPVGATDEEHLLTPLVNCFTDLERALATAVSFMLQRERAAENLRPRPRVIG